MIVCEPQISCRVQLSVRHSTPSLLVRVKCSIHNSNGSKSIWDGAGGTGSTRNAAGAEPFGNASCTEIATSQKKLGGLFFFLMSRDVQALKRATAQLRVSEICQTDAAEHCKSVYKIRGLVSEWE